MNEILRLFPRQLRHKINDRVHSKWHELQEIRLRLDKPIELSFFDRVEWIEDIKFTSDEGNYVLNQLSEHSLYRMETELKEGFITVAGGHRVGLAGKVTTSNGRVKGLQFITSFNIRIAQQIIGLAHSLIDYMNKQNDYLHTLIIGAPQSGKTTLLRDITRLISRGYGNVSSKKVAVIDERSEIAASKNGIPQFDIGHRTDVLDACPKSDGMMMVIRSMSPDVIVVDEIGKREDVQALLDVFHAGVTIVCTVHGSSLAEVKKRLSLQSLFTQSIFKRYIYLTYDKNEGFTYKVYNEDNGLLSTVDAREAPW